MDVKTWAARQPSCSAVRPSKCTACSAASRPAGSALVIVGHGQRVRTVEGPPAPGQAPALTEVVTRRYRCRACHAILVVVPAGVSRGYRYGRSAIAWALSLWGYEHVPAASVRAQTSTAKIVGASAVTRWASLRRWTRCALSLFGIATGEQGTLRERAAAVATFVAAHAPISWGRVSLDAFFGAAFCGQAE